MRNAVRHVYGRTHQAKLPHHYIHVTDMCIESCAKVSCSEPCVKVSCSEPCAKVSCSEPCVKAAYGKAACVKAACAKACQGVSRRRAFICCMLLAVNVPERGAERKSQRQTSDRAFRGGSFFTQHFVNVKVIWREGGGSLAEWTGNQQMV